MAFLLVVWWQTNPGKYRKRFPRCVALQYSAAPSESSLLCLSTCSFIFVTPSSPHLLGVFLEGFLTTEGRGAPDDSTVVPVSEPKKLCCLLGRKASLYLRMSYFPNLWHGNALVRRRSAEISGMCRSTEVRRCRKWRIHDRRRVELLPSTEPTLLEELRSALTRSLSIFQERSVL